MSQTQMQPNRGSTTSSPPPLPRWVKVFGIIALVLVLLVGVIMLTGGGEHGPSRHTPPATVSVPESGDPGGHTPPIEHGG